MVDGKNFRLTDEVRYILRRAAEHDGRVVTIGPLVLFSTETGDAWLLDPSDQLAARLARDGDPEPFDTEENETTFTIDWKGRYRIEGAKFVYMDRETRRLATIHGYRLGCTRSGNWSAKSQLFLLSSNAPWRIVSAGVSVFA